MIKGEMANNRRAIDEVVNDDWQCCHVQEAG